MREIFASALVGILFINILVFATPGSLPFLSVGQPDRRAAALVRV